VKSEKLRIDKLHEVAKSATLHSSLFTSRSHSGQVALYLIAVLVAICVLTIMNVSIYLSVSAKNKAMNAGDSAALAVANYQGELLNRIGQMNLDHLKAALENDENGCGQIMKRQLRVSFLGPISGVDGGNMAFPSGGFSAGDKMAEENGTLRYVDAEDWYQQHAQEIREVYATNPESYPEPWEGAWEEYAQALEMAVCDEERCLRAIPCSVDFIDVKGGHLLLEPQFYNAVAGRCWCWFHFNAAGLLGTYGNYHDWGPLPYSDLETRLRRCVNSEFYSLNLRMRMGSAVDLLGTNLICRLTGATESDIANSYMITNALQEWMFYDDDVWREWREIMQPFPVVGQVRSEYNVRGCSALCWVECGGVDLFSDVDHAGSPFGWMAGAKPFGTVVNEDGELDVVTAYKNFVTPAFDQVHLVPIDAVGGMDVGSPELGWLDHVREHLPIYLQGGVAAIGSKDCWYCQQLVIWERPSFRSEGIRWLKYNSGNCVRPLPGSGIGGGTPHGH